MNAAQTLLAAVSRTIELGNVGWATLAVMLVTTATAGNRQLCMRVLDSANNPLFDLATSPLPRPKSPFLCTRARAALGVHSTTWKPSSGLSGSGSSIITPAKGVIPRIAAGAVLAVDPTADLQPTPAVTAADHLTEASAVGILQQGSDVLLNDFDPLLAQRLGNDAIEVMGAGRRD